MSIYSEELYGGANPKAKCLSSAVTVNYTRERGRHIVATEDIPPGALILDEMPYSCTLYDQCCEYFCQFCLEPLQADQQPVTCDRCNDGSNIYCSVSCRDRAWLAHHQYECGPIRVLLKCVGLRQHSVLLALRALVQTPVQLIIEAYNKLVNLESETLVHGEHPDDTFNTKQDHFSVIMSLLPDDDSSPILPPKDVRIGLSKLCGFVVERLQELESPLLQTYAGWPEDIQMEQRVVIMETVLHAIMKRLSRNRQGMLEHRRMTRPEVVELFAGELESHKASGVFPTGALLNHACIPNVHMLFGSGGRMLARTIATVKAGQPINHCYGSKFGRHNRAERQSHLQHDYCFVCDCEACTSDEYRIIEQEMDMIRCPSCSTECHVPDPDDPPADNAKPVDCALCGAELQPAIENIDTLINTMNTQIEAESVDCVKLLKNLINLETSCHPNNKRCNEMRGKVGSILTANGFAEQSERFLVQHVSTSKRHCGPLSLRTALALSRLTQVYRETGSEKYWLTAAVMIRIHLNHYGARQVKIMFEQNGLTHFLPAIEIIEQNHA